MNNRTHIRTDGISQERHSQTHACTHMQQSYAHTVAYYIYTSAHTCTPDTHTYAHTVAYIHT